MYSEEQIRYISRQMDFSPIDIDGLMSRLRVYVKYNNTDKMLEAIKTAESKFPYPIGVTGPRILNKIDRHRKIWVEGYMSHLIQ